MRNPRFENGQIYHVFNRGVEKRDVFQDSGDLLRFVHHLYELNNEQHAENLTYRFSKDPAEVTLASKRDQLVQILAFVLMPNHYHLLIQQKADYGISKFMQKVGTGYTMFFNDKYTRTGALFQGKFKAVLISNDIQLRYILHYIHLNPISLYKQDSTQNEKITFLKEYKWSSLIDYIGGKSFPSVTYRNNMLEIFGGTMKYEESLVQAMAYKTLPDALSPSLLHDLNSL
jgi:putative transposase